MKGREGKSLTKQVCVVGDKSGCGRVVLWEKNVGTIVEGTSYNLIAVRVRSFKGVNYTPESEIVRINDIGGTAEVVEDDLEDCGIINKTIEGKIDGVMNRA